MWFGGSEQAVQQHLRDEKSASEHPERGAAQPAKTDA